MHDSRCCQYTINKPPCNVKAPPDLIETHKCIIWRPLIKQEDGHILLVVPCRGLTRTTHGREWVNSFASCGMPSKAAMPLGVGEITTWIFPRKAPEYARPCSGRDALQGDGWVDCELLTTVQALERATERAFVCVPSTVEALQTHRSPPPIWQRC